MFANMRTFGLFALVVGNVNAIVLDVTSSESIKDTAKTIAQGMVSFYHGNEVGQTPGLLPYPPSGYYWWEAGAMFGSLISYWHITGDTTYNAITSQALLFQVGPDNDYSPPNQTASLGNDDQSFWAMSALAAAEYNFPTPADPKAPSWLALAQAVFNEQIARWDTTTCNGGIRWQAVPTNTGYDLKNSISNGCLFNIASRLAKYTGDQNYADWAVKIWDWMDRIGLLDAQYHVYDNSEAQNLNCTQLDENQWTYNAGTMIMGASNMYNFTNGDPMWANRTAGLLSTLTVDFFANGIMQEGCEAAGTGPNGCNTDQKSFKAYLSRWLTVTAQVAPFTLKNITSLLQSSAIAAAAQCNGQGAGGNYACGIRWDLNGTWDGTEGVGQQMCALETVLGTMLGIPSNFPGPPLTNATGGTSISNPTAGHNASAIYGYEPAPPATKSDRIGAWFLTMFIAVCSVWCIWFMWSTAWEPSYEERIAMDKGRDKGKGKMRVVIPSNEVKSVAPAGEGGLPTIGEAEKGFISAT